MNKKTHAGKWLEKRIDKTIWSKVGCGATRASRPRWAKFEFMVPEGEVISFETTVLGSGERGRW